MEIDRTVITTAKATPSPVSGTQTINAQNDNVQPIGTMTMNGNTWLIANSELQCGRKGAAGYLYVNGNAQVIANKLFFVGSRAYQ